MKKSNNTILYGGLAVLAVAGIATLSKKKPEPLKGQENFESPSGEIKPTPIAPIKTATINKGLVLKNGSKGIEVVELQKLLSVTADGIFGNGTETALFNKKGVKQISLNGYATAPNRNLNPLKAGDKIMSNNPKGTQTYKALEKADKTFYTNLDKDTLLPYGAEIGTIKTLTSGGVYYSVVTSSWLGTKIIFVKAQDVKKY